MKNKKLIDLTVGEAMKAGIVWLFVVYPFARSIDRQLVRSLENSKTLKKMESWVEERTNKEEKEQNPLHIHRPDNGGYA